jgi:O-methyltransferase
MESSNGAQEHVGMLRRVYWLGVVGMASAPSILAFLRDKEIGGEYGIGFYRKLSLLVRFRRNLRRIETLSTLLEHLELAGAVLSLPRSVAGDIVECGCFVGGSSVNLSLACAMVGRRLVICDSFAGLPQPGEHDRAHQAVHTGHVDEYEEGLFASSLEVTKGNIERYGRLDVCDFVVGFFDETMPGFERNVAMAFLDVDLIDSLTPCLQGLWPQLQSGCRLYLHEARNLPLAAVFFDTSWWRDTLDTDAPGLVGAGSGLALQAVWGSELGYAQKDAPAAGPSA